MLYIIAKGKDMSKLLDRFGICASSICLVHCLATPFVIFFFPSFKEIFNEQTHELFAVVVIAFIVIAVFPHCKRHGNKDIIALAFSGVSFILAAIFLEDLMPLLLHYGLTMVGSILLIIAHLKNIRVRHGNCSHK